MPLDFKKLMSARFLFTFAVQMQAVVLGWRIYEILRDPLALGFIGLAEAVPAIGLALYAGYLIDRMAPLKVYRGVMSVSFLSGLIVLSEHSLQNYLPLAAQVSLLYFGSFLTGTARAFSQPAIFASVPRMVPRDQLLQATATMSSAMQIARIAGPAAGGLTFAFFGATVSSIIVCVGLIAASLFVKSIKMEIPAPAAATQNLSVKKELLSGVQFVFSHPILLPALSLDMISVLFGGVTALLPIFAKEILFIGPKGLGILRAAPAVGASLMSLYLARFHQKFRTGKALLIAITGFGFCILIFGFSKNYFISLAALGLSGAFDSISMVIRSSIVQLSSPDHMRGKISAVNSIFIGSSNEIGEFESGIAAKVLGTIPAVYVGGIICLITVSTVSNFSKSLRQLDLVKLKN